MKTAPLHQVTRAPWFSRRRLRPGTLVEKYEVVALVGSGGYGDVYEAVHVKLGRRVALKMLHVEHAENSQAYASFLNEARTLARLRDENLVQVFDCGSFEGRPWTAMEYLRGQTLDRLLLGDEPFALTDALHAAACIASGLAVAHANGIVHRDVKPENVFATDEGRVVLVDFGTAKALENRRPSQKVIGTAAYMAPERVRGAPAGPWTDIYALGLVLYELLTGTPAFPRAPGMSLAQVLALQVNEYPRPIPSLAPWVPPYVVEIVWDAIQKEPSARTGRATEFRDQCLAAIRRLRAEGNRRAARELGKLDARAPWLVPDTEPVVSLSVRVTKRTLSPMRTRHARVPAAVISFAIGAIASVIGWLALARAFPDFFPSLGVRAPEPVMSSAPARPNRVEGRTR